MRVTSSVVVTLVAAVLLAGCASDSAAKRMGTPKLTPTAASTAPTTPSTPSTAPEADQEASQGVSPDANRGRSEALAACRVIHDEDYPGISQMKRAAPLAQTAAEVSSRWSGLSSAMSGLRDYVIKYDPDVTIDIEEADWRQSVTDWETIEAECFELLGTTVLTP